MHTGEEIIHTTASENLSFATGWLLFSIVLGSVLTFTLFNAISTSFYCCKKPIKKKDKGTQSRINTGNSTQKLLFPIVPSSVYPTIQSILQQEDNEVIDSLSPAYRELPSTHFTYVSSFSGSFDSTTFGNDQTTILPNSTKSSVQPYTQSSEQLKIQKISNDSAISQRNTSNPNSGNNSSRSIDIASTVKDLTISQKSPSLINPDLIDDGSLSIHIITAPEDPLQYPTLSTNEMINEEDQKIQRESNRNSRIEPTINDDQLKEPALNDEQKLTEPAINNSRLSEPVVNDHQLNYQRQCTKSYGPNRNAATTSSTNNNICDSSRGASSFGGIELSPKARAFSPDYYALTFRREESGLSDVSCGSLRGASAFSGASEQRKSPIRHGASAFGQTSEGLQQPEREGSHMNETKEESNRQTGFLNITYDLNKKSQLGTGGSCTMEETKNEIKISNSSHASEKNDKATKILSPSPNHHEVKTNSVYSVESNSPKLRCENQSIERLPRAVSTINKRQYSSKLSTKSHRVNVREDERKSEIKPDSQNDGGEKNKAKSITAQLYSSSDLKKPATLSSKHITAQQHRVLDKPIKTLRITPRVNTAPITSLQNTLRYSSKPIDNLNTTYHSLRGASQLGHLGDDDVCSDTDAFWDSVSLSFAYDSPSEEDSVSHFRFKEN